MSRSTKKFLYGVFYLIILGLIVYVVSGGFGSAPASPAILPLRVAAEPTVLSLADGPGVILARFSNPNGGYGASDFAYVLKFYDSAGRLIDQAAGRSFIYPLETKYVFLIDEAGAGVKAARIETAFSEIGWEEAADFSPPAFSIKNIRSFFSGERVEVSGDIMNEGIFDLAEIRLTAVLFDRFGFPLFASETKISDLPSLGQRSFSILFPASRDLIEKADLGQSQVFGTARQ